MVLIYVLYYRWRDQFTEEVLAERGLNTASEEKG